MDNNYDFLRDNPCAAYYEDCAREYRGIGSMAEKVIDTHCHIYPSAIASKAVQAVNRFYSGLLRPRSDGTAQALLREGKEQNISHFIVHSVATGPAQVSKINHFIADSVAQSEGAFTGMGTLHMGSENTGRDFEEICSLGLHGVKLHPDIQRFYTDEPWAMSVYEMCDDKGLPICVHTGDYRYDFSNPDRIAGILRRFPHLKFIGAHFSGWSVWQEAMEKLSDFPNLIVDTSSSLYWQTPQKAIELIRAFGSDRVMFGTDYPLFPREPELEYLRRLDLLPEEYEDICWRTCSRLFGLQ